ncbi:hypothetical protein [Kurthia sibirica]|uniref:Uncharacterized protein n=1 Tax=Kurthia sibirica TaxID=202750 RepID=A0A2U3AE68_9BACL|nr:hypothetical protein [Kurthia sibirica]PWI22741.1 hypothetical protein DEX24_16745 [Kurthia sibirica]GEK35682.1 hypothetical protein KSI01_32150 [Kurthia sibirica]
MKLFTKILSIVTSFFLINTIIVSGTATAETSEPRVALKAEGITGTEDLIQSTNGLLENNLNSIVLPDKNDKKIIINNKEDNNQLSIGLPNDMNLANPKVTDSGSYEYKNKGSVDLILQPTELGVRSIINIKDADAPKEYKFDLDLPKGHKLITSYAYFKGTPGDGFDTEEVFIVDENNIIQSVFGKAWAVDANGKEVPTKYEVVGNTLIQTVDFNENTAFPVLADPDWVAIGACAAALTWFVGSNLFAAAKIIKVKKYIKALGGFKESAKLLVSATTWEEKLRVGGSAFKSLAAEITGVSGLYVCSKFIKK